ncbi:hypothetical protein GA0115234_10097 [Streptomyces sp. DvalAA-43]|nr:hypothetical protein GA0115234_10097 [Streptomyces sp. DvalAA-43]
MGVEEAAERGVTVRAGADVSECAAVVAQGGVPLMPEVGQLMAAGDAVQAGPVLAGADEQPGLFQEGAGERLSGARFGLGREPRKPVRGAAPEAGGDGYEVRGGECSGVQAADRGELVCVGPCVGGQYVLRGPQRIASAPLAQVRPVGGDIEVTQYP